MQSFPQIFLRPDEIKLTQLYIELFERYEKTHGPISASNPRDVVAAQMASDLYAHHLKDLNPFQMQEMMELFAGDPVALFESLIPKYLARKAEEEEQAAKILDTDQAKRMVQLFASRFGEDGLEFLKSLVVCLLSCNLNTSDKAFTEFMTLFALEHFTLVRMKQFIKTMDDWSKLLKSMFRITDDAAAAAAIQKMSSYKNALCCTALCLQHGDIFKGHDTHDSLVEALKQMMMFKIYYNMPPEHVVQSQTSEMRNLMTFAAHASKYKAVLSFNPANSYNELSGATIMVDECSRAPGMDGSHGRFGKLASLVSAHPSPPSTSLHAKAVNDMREKLKKLAESRTKQSANATKALKDAQEHCNDVREYLTDFDDAKNGNDRKLALGNAARCVANAERTAVSAETAYKNVVESVATASKICDELLSAEVDFLTKSSAPHEQKNKFEAANAECKKNLALEKSVTDAHAAANAARTAVNDARDDLRSKEEVNATLLAAAKKFVPSVTKKDKKADQEKADQEKAAALEKAAHNAAVNAHAQKQRDDKQQAEIKRVDKINAEAERAAAAADKIDIVDFKKLFDCNYQDMFADAIGDEDIIQLFKDDPHFNKYMKFSATSGRALLIIGILIRHLKPANKIVITGKTALQLLAIANDDAIEQQNEKYPPLLVSDKNTVPGSCIHMPCSDLDFLFVTDQSATPNLKKTLLDVILALFRPANAIAADTYAMVSNAAAAARSSGASAADVSSAARAAADAARDDAEVAFRITRNYDSSEVSRETYKSFLENPNQFLAVVTRGADNTISLKKSGGDVYLRPIDILDVKFLTKAEVASVYPHLQLSSCNLDYNDFDLSFEFPDESNLLNECANVAVRELTKLITTEITWYSPNVKSSGDLFYFFAITTILKFFSRAVQLSFIISAKTAMTTHDIFMTTVSRLTENPQCLSLITDLLHVFLADEVRLNPDAFVSFNLYKRSPVKSPMIRVGLEFHQTILAILKKHGVKPPPSNEYMGGKKNKSKSMKQHNKKKRLTRNKKAHKTKCMTRKL